MITLLIDALQKRSGSPDSLHLPQWNADDWRLLLADADTVEIENGSILLKRGDTSNDLYFLVDGELEVSVPRRQSMSMSPLISIGPGSVVGELSFFDNHGRSASVWSRGKSTLLRLREASFRSFMDAHPRKACDLLLALGQIISERLRRSHGAVND